jgi:hypothetical protein
MIYDPNNLMIRLPFSLDDYAQLPKETNVTLFTSIGGELYEWDAEIMWDLGEVGQKTLSAFVLARIFANEEHGSQFVLPLPGIFFKCYCRGCCFTQSRQRASISGSREESDFGA